MFNRVTNNTDNLCISGYQFFSPFEQVSEILVTIRDSQIPLQLFYAGSAKTLTKNPLEKGET